MAGLTEFKKGANFREAHSCGTCDHTLVTMHGRIWCTFREDEEDWFMTEDQSVCMYYKQR